MFFSKEIIVLQIISNILVITTAQWCVKSDRGTEMAIKLNNGQRLVQKLNESFPHTSGEHNIYDKLTPICCNGYRKVNDTHCDPICQTGCPTKSHCVRPNICECQQGYEMFQNKCQPICTEKCPENSICIKPNLCDCLKDFEKIEHTNSSIQCLSKCNRECPPNSKCVGPNKCECLKGYEMDELGVCQPACSKGCQNGLCFQPEICICNPGFVMGPHEQCVPACLKHCQNASCIAPEICQCYEGYQFKNGSKNICEPICKSKCINGLCTENCEPFGTNFELKKLPESENTINLPNEYYSYEEITPSQAASLIISSTPSESLVSANICSNMCECWHEYDEFGPLANKKCTPICLSPTDKHCLNLTLCLCDENKIHLTCRTPDDSVEDPDPLRFMCTTQNNGVTIIKVINKTTTVRKTSSNAPWIIGSCVGILVFSIVVGGFLYIRFRRVEEPIMDYELCYTRVQQ